MPGKFFEKTYAYLHIIRFSHTHKHSPNVIHIHLLHWLPSTPKCPQLSTIPSLKHLRPISQPISPKRHHHPPLREKAAANQATGRGVTFTRSARPRPLSLSSSGAGPPGNAAPKATTVRQREMKYSEVCPNYTLKAPTAGARDIDVFHPRLYTHARAGWGTIYRGLYRRIDLNRGPSWKAEPAANSLIGAHQGAPLREFLRGRRVGTR